MSKIKSERAKERLEHAVGEAYEFTYDINVVELSMAESAVEFAEYDAEERAVKAFDQWCRRVNKSIDEEIHKQVILEFKQLLNGGQSDV